MSIFFEWVWFFQQQIRWNWSWIQINQTQSKYVDHFWKRFDSTNLQIKTKSIVDFDIVDFSRHRQLILITLNINNRKSFYNRMTNYMFNINFELRKKHEKIIDKITKIEFFVSLINKTIKCIIIIIQKIDIKFNRI